MLLRPEGFRPQADAWEYLHDAMERGLTLEARVVRVTWPETRPVWEVELPGGIRGLVPSSETGLGDAAAMPRYVGQVINVKIKGLDRENGLAACSRREAVAEASGAYAAGAASFPSRQVFPVAVLPPDKPREGAVLAVLLDGAGPEGAGPGSLWARAVDLEHLPLPECLHRV